MKQRTSPSIPGYSNAISKPPGLSDRHESIIRACEITLPFTHHLYCLHHLNGNIATNTRPSLGPRWKEFATEFWAVYRSISPEQFEQGWILLMERFTMTKGYLSELYTCRRRWAWAWIGSELSYKPRSSTTVKFYALKRITLAVLGNQNNVSSAYYWTKAVQLKGMTIDRRCSVWYQFLPSGKLKPSSLSGRTSPRQSPRPMYADFRFDDWIVTSDDSGLAEPTVISSNFEQILPDNLAGLDANLLGHFLLAVLSNTFSPVDHSKLAHVRSSSAPTNHSVTPVLSMYPGVEQPSPLDDHPITPNEQPLLNHAESDKACAPLLSSRHMHEVAHPPLASDTDLHTPDLPTQHTSVGTRNIKRRSTKNATVACDRCRRQKIACSPPEAGRDGKRCQ
ncbi:hypothetical protein FA15DRAFT_658066 [Coprinopsis marcescibilis]|uniref:Uncharacterized protein n=1 Tax=Coprinopsis marcescibilis TaxID=230819 RepID=A0A5C3KMQ9_COPMA|nr:hypothetical protein FA15DRAFT_658066 [Coprinopsis marcescibilis]